MSRRGKVLVAMSGGIDSTVTALMLHNEGYEVVGITMKTWDYATSGGSSKETGCCNIDSFNDARMAAVQNGFPHFILDIREEFGDAVIENFVEEYLAGRTPNPCVMCNTHIKWKALLKRANALGCDFIATGHYANVYRHQNGRYVISKGLDETKDQSYVLWGLDQELLSRTIMPLGKYRKTEIRQMALDYGYPELAKKSESYEICFVPDNDYRGFLKRRVEGLEESGEILDLLRFGDACERHLGARDLGLRVLDVLGKGRFVPGDARILVGIGVVVARDRSRLAADQAIQFRADAVLGGGADLMTGAALVEDLLAGFGVLRVSGTGQCDKRQRHEKGANDHQSRTSCWENLAG